MFRTWICDYQFVSPSQEILLIYYANVQVALHYVNLMAYEAHRAEQTLSLHKGVATMTLSIIKPFVLKLG